MKLTCEMKTLAMESTLSGWEKQQLPFATAVALTRVGQRIKDAIRATEQVSFDRPTPYTLNAIFLQSATKTNLTCTVSLKTQASKGLPPSVYLAPQVYGGDRQAKASEKLLQRRGVLPGGMLWVPGSGARLDQYGNMSRGQIVQVISALGANANAGYTANKSYRIGARRNLHTDGYFVITQKTGHLVPGVYLRTKDGIKPIMIFVSHANYKVRLPFGQIANTVYGSSFQVEFVKALRDASILTPFLQAA